MTLIVAKTKRSILVAASLAVVALASARGQTSDVTPPQLAIVAITPASVDVSASAQTVVVDLDVTDNLSGVAMVVATFVSPNGTIAEQQAVSVGGASYRATITIPRFAANGTWSLRLTLVDGVGNRAVITPAVLQQRGFPSTISVTSSPVDNSPPTIAAIGFSPAIVDVSTQRRSVTIQLQVHDDLSGVFVDPTFVSAFSCILQSPVGQQIRLSNPDFTVTGTPQASVWQATFDVPQYADAGTWNVVLLRVVDAAGNLRNLGPADFATAGVNTALTVTSTISDRMAPNLTEFSITPTVINTSLGTQTVHVSLGLTDDLSGVSFRPRTFFNRLFFTSPSGQSVAAVQPDFTLVPGGTSHDGTWKADLVFPQFSEAGTWNATFLRLEDSTYNLRFLNQAGIAALGFNTSVVVIRPSLTVDGSIGSSGGVVQDQTFGARAKVIALSNVLPGPTSISIDVLTSSFQLPMPTGFETTGSLYVNITLTPNPSPLPPPGLSVVLPLPSPQPAGLQLSLFKIDPSTGNLVQEMDANGTPIIGKVQADGLSAIFSGVISFSTVVGLLPAAIPVTIALKPGDGTSTINLRSRGTAPVVVYSTPTFNALDIDPSTVVLAGAAARMNSTEDVNGDGLPDRVFHFSTQDLQLAAGDTEVTLEGRLLSGLRVRGTAVISVRP